ncbi:MAG: cation:proton antiporter [Deltaproteobacteria bacterium]|nr:cation:proton antiporter [Deltaproteobacteria bacterium]
MLIDLVLLLAIACAGLLVGRLLGLPAMVSWLLAGVVAGPAGLGLLGYSDNLARLAELGVALLLFGVGVEFSLVGLRQRLARLLATGGAQVVVTAGATTLLFHEMGLTMQAAVVAGMLVSLSSTAVVFRLYSVSGELSAPHGQAAAGVLLFQDLALVAMMMVLPLLGGAANASALELAMGVARAVAAVVFLLVAARALLPPLLELAARAGAAELFPPLALLVALGTAMGASALGLSLPVGAFLAGLALSGSPYAQQATAELLPLRDAFLAVFFTSVGLLFAPSEIGSGGLLVLAMLAAVLLKGAVSAAVVALGWRSVRVGLMAGVGLAQVGEFSFVLGQEALGLGLIDDAFFQAFLGAAILSMAVTPFATQAARRLYDSDISAPGGDARQANAPAGVPGAERVLLLGYGQAGRAMARVLDSSGLSFVALDLAVDRVNEGIGDGHDLRFGDASRRATLEAAGGANCRAVVVALGDPWATRAAVRLLRQMNPDAPILARAGNEEEISVLEKLGADEVISTGFESSVHLLASLLERLGVPRHVARVQESILRMDAYGVLRGHAASAQLLPEVDRLLRGGTLVTAEVMQGSRACGSSLARLVATISGEQTAGKQTPGERTPPEEMAAVLSLVRDEQPLSNPPVSTILEAGDLLVLYGPHAGIDAVLRQLEPPAADDPRNRPAADDPEG